MHRIFRHRSDSGAFVTPWRTFPCRDLGLAGPIDSLHARHRRLAEQRRLVKAIVHDPHFADASSEAMDLTPSLRTSWKTGSPRNRSCSVLITSNVTGALGQALPVPIRPARCRWQWRVRNRHLSRARALCAGFGRWETAGAVTVSHQDCRTKRFTLRLWAGCWLRRYDTYAKQPRCARSLSARTDWTPATRGVGSRRIANLRSHQHACK